MKSISWLAPLALAIIVAACSSSPAPTVGAPTSAPTSVPTSTVAPTPRPLVPTTVPPTAAPTPAPTPTRAPTATPRPMVARLTVAQGMGEYQVVGTTAWVAIRPGVSLGEGDSVRSAVASRVSVEFQDGSVLVLEPDSQLEIQSFIATTQGSQVVMRVARVALIKGDITGDVRQDLVYPPSVFEIVSKGEITTIPGTLK